MFLAVFRGSPKRYLKQVRLALKPSRSAVKHHGIDRHSSKIQIDSVQIIGEDFERNLSTGRSYLCELIVERKGNIVMRWSPRIDDSFATLGSKTARHTGDDQEGGEQNQTFGQSIQ